jgi:hypothetical protein
MADLSLIHLPQPGCIAIRDRGQKLAVWREGDIEGGAQLKRPGNFPGSRTPDIYEAVIFDLWARESRCKYVRFWSESNLAYTSICRKKAA